MKRLDRNTSAFALNVSGLPIETPHREVALSDGDVASAWIQLGRRCLAIFGALASELPTDKLCPLRREQAERCRVIACITKTWPHG